MIVSPALSVALRHSTDVFTRFKELSYFLEDIKYLYLNFTEYENGLSNKYSLEHEMRELKEYSKFNLKQYEESNEKIFLLISELLDEIVLLADHFLTCLNLMEAMEIPDYEAEKKYIQSIYTSFQKLVAFQNGLGDATSDELHTFFALYNIKSTL